MGCGDVIGLTPVGRATVEVLALNGPLLLSIRQTLVDEGVFRLP